MLPPPVFAERLMPKLLALGSDPIPNVRLNVARVITQRFVTSGI